MGENTYPVSALRICIDDIFEEERPVLRGKIVGVAVERTCEFSSSFDLMLKIDEVLDIIGKPQASRKLRSFHKNEDRDTQFRVNPKRFHPSEDIMAEHGRILTVDAYFVSRLHSSWQGFIKNEAGEKLADFTSDMEFIECIKELLYED